MAARIREFLVICLFTAWTEALPGGAPSMACSSMTPYHFAFQPQPLAESPFLIRQSKLSYTPGNDTIVVALTSTKGRTFKGFLIKAFNPVTNRPIGKFRADSAVGSRDTCHAATHVNAEEKNFAVVHWSAKDVEEDENFVVFEATFVESFRKFYVGVESLFKGNSARREAETLRHSTTEQQTDEDGSVFRDHSDEKPSTSTRSHIFWF